MTPLVTIALPAYNGSSTLKLAVDSILNQSFHNWELIILDDASTDSSLEVMRLFDDSRIHIVEGKENIGLSARLNMAIDMAQGQYFARMDQDDISFPLRIEKQLSFLQKHPDVDLLATNYAVFNDNFECLGKLQVKQLHRDICLKPWNGFYMPHPTWLGKLEWFKYYRYKSYADGAEDQNMMLRSYDNSIFACMDDVLLAYRQNDRPLKKIIRARARYAKSAFFFCYRDGRIYLLMRVLIAQLFKGCIDIANTLVRNKRFQRSLLQLHANEKDYLNKIFKQLN